MAVFFLMIRRPPRSTLFPTRRSSDLRSGDALSTTASGKSRYAANGAAYLEDRKSTRLNSSHANISYAVFCLKKKKKTRNADSVTSRGMLSPARQDPTPQCELKPMAPL